MRLCFESVACRYGSGAPVLSEITFSVGPGLWVVKGPNGSGKSTLLRCAAGVISPARGRVLWNGEDAARLGARYRWQLGYAPQESGGYPELTAREYLLSLAALKGIRPALQGVRVQEMLQLTDLTGVATLRVSDLSGGMTSRLGLAQALLNDPDLLLLDEPATGLDPEERVKFRNLVQDLARERVVLMATNLPEEAEGMADGVLTLRNGGLATFED